MNNLMHLLKQASKLAGVLLLGMPGGFFLLAFAYLVGTDP